MRIFITAILLAVTAAVATWSVAGAGGGGGGHGCTPRTETRGLQVDLRGNCFTPTVLHVAVGETVQWTNRDTQQHNVLAVDKYDNRWPNGKALAQGDSVSVTFDQAGIFPYYCSYHPGMIGAVAVDATGGETVAFQASTSLSTGDEARPDVPVKAKGADNAPPSVSAEFAGVAGIFALLIAGLFGLVKISGGFPVRRR